MYGYSFDNKNSQDLQYTGSASLTVAVLLSAEECGNLTQRLEDYNYSEH